MMKCKGDPRQESGDKILILSLYRNTSLPFSLYPLAFTLYHLPSLDRRRSLLANKWAIAWLILGIRLSPLYPTIGLL